MSEARLAPVGSLLASMTTTRDHVFRALLRRRPNGSTYMPCQREGCGRNALDPTLYCSDHADDAQIARLRRLEPPSPDERRVEARARHLAAQDGRPDAWREPRYLDTARNWNGKRSEGAGDLVDVV